MTVTGGQVVRQAREWMGTPWHHQGRVRGAGVDCAGVIVGVASALGLSSFDTTGYGHRPDSLELQEICHSNMIPVDRADAQPGDVLLIEVDRQPQHLAFLTDVGMLHAYAPLRRVVEHRIDQSWEDRILSVFRLPGVE